MVVLKKNSYDAYILAELNGMVSKLHFAAFQLVPYHAWSHPFIPLSDLLDPRDLAALNDETHEDRYWFYWTSGGTLTEDGQRILTPREM